MDFLEKFKRAKNINNDSTEANLNGQSLKTLCEKTFLNFIERHNSIQNETKVNFDISKLCNQTVGSKKLNGKIKAKKGEKMTFSPKI